MRKIVFDTDTPAPDFLYFWFGLFWFLDAFEPLCVRWLVGIHADGACRNICCCACDCMHLAMRREPPQCENKIYHSEEIVVQSIYN